MHEFNAKLLDKVHASVLAFNRKSFVVKAELEMVNKYSVRERWNSLSLADASEIFDRLTPLAEPLDGDESAKNFNLMMLKFMLVITNGCEPIGKYITKIKAIGNGLLKMFNVPDIKETEPIVRYILSNDVVRWKIRVVQLEMFQ